MFIGFLNYNEVDFNFVFDGTELRLIPPNDKQFEVCFDWGGEKLAEGIVVHSEPLKMKEKYLIGIDAETNKKILFITRQNSIIANCNGVLYIEIYAYIVFRDDVEKVSKISFSSPEISSIYRNNQAFSVQRDEIREFHKTGKIKIETKNFDETSTPKQIFVADNQEISVNFDIGRTFNPKIGEPLLSLDSCMNFEFAPTDDYSFIMNLWRYAKKFIEFLCYRRDVCLSNVKLYAPYDDNDTIICGNLYVLNEDRPTDLNSLRKGRYIKYAYISGNEGKILSDIASNTLYLRHIPKSYEEGTVIDASRFVMITAAFEWEFRRNYPNGITKSQKTIDIEKIVTKAIDALIKQSTGKIKEKYKFLKRFIKSDSLQSEIVQVGKDYSEIVDIFGNHLYHLNGEKLDYSEMGKRISDQRNHFAHGDLDEEFIGNSLLDLLFLEYIIYAIQLKMFGVSDYNIKKSINDLFHRGFNL